MSIESKGFSIIWGTLKSIWVQIPYVNLKLFCWKGNITFHCNETARLSGANQCRHSGRFNRGTIFSFLPAIPCPSVLHQEQRSVAFFCAKTLGYNNEWSRSVNYMILNSEAKRWKSMNQKQKGNPGNNHGWKKGFFSWIPGSIMWVWIEEKSRRK